MNERQKSWRVERKRRRGAHRAVQFVERREFVYLFLTVTAFNVWPEVYRMFSFVPPRVLRARVNSFTKSTGLK